MTSTETEQIGKLQGKLDSKLENNGKQDDDAETEELMLSSHIELPSSPYFNIGLARKQGTKSENVIIALTLPGFKEHMDFKLRITTPGYDKSVPDLITATIRKLQNFKKHYKTAQKKALEIQPNLLDFFLA